jgi:hypothetical protein
LIALGAITEGPEKMKLMQVIVPGLPNLVNMFNDQHAKVREAISWVMSKICEHHSDIITNDPNTLAGIMPSFIGAVKDKPRIST